MYHHALTSLRSTGQHELEPRGITSTELLVKPKFSGTRTSRFLSKIPLAYLPDDPGVTAPTHAGHWLAPRIATDTRVRLLSALLGTNWHPLVNLYAHNKPQGKIGAWQSQTDVKECIRIHTNYQSILSSRYGAASLCNSLHAPLPRLLATPLCQLGGPDPDQVVHVYTDGSTMNNGSAACVSAVAWVSDCGKSDHCHLLGMPMSNNVAEVIAVALALHSWRSANLHIHTDSKYVIKLLEGGLLELENNGWSSLPWTAFPPGCPPVLLSSILQFLLYLIRYHQGSLSVSWVKAHANDPLNKQADHLAKAVLTSSDTVILLDFSPPGVGGHLPNTGWEVPCITDQIRRL